MDFLESIKTIVEFLTLQLLEEAPRYGTGNYILAVSVKNRVPLHGLLSITLLASGSGSSGVQFWTPTY